MTAAEKWAALHVRDRCAVIQTVLNASMVLDMVSVNMPMLIPTDAFDIAVDLLREAAKGTDDAR